MMRRSRVLRPEMLSSLGILSVAFAASSVSAGGFAGFTDPVRWPAGLEPSDVQTADLNGDGHTDILVLNQAASTLTALLGRGDGTFDRLAPVSTISAPKAMALGDFTDDQRPDVAVVTASGAVLATHVNNGDGTFGVAELHNIGAKGDSIVTADFNSDNCGDLFIAHIDARRLTHLTSLGNGSFEITRVFDVPHYPWSIETADINGDDMPDLGVGLLPGGQGNAIRVLLNDGNGGFLAPVDTPITRQPVDIAFGDFNRDDRLDCATIDKTAGSATILRGSGDGSFASPQSYAFDGQAEEVEVFDVNGDGIDDVVAAHSYFHRVTTLVGVGDGQFLFGVWQDVGAQAHDLAQGDFDGDGFLDLVVGHTIANIDIVSVLLNRSIPGAAAALIDVQAAVGRIELGGVRDIEHSDNAYLQAAPTLGSASTPGLIDLRVAARTDEPAPTRLNITIEAQITEESGIEQVRLLNWKTGRFEVVMDNATGRGDRLNRVLGLDAQPYVGENGEIIASLRYSTTRRSQFGRFLALVDWVEIAVE